jgi:glycosyltransferase involved in cell wall biosynthesis
VAAPDSERKGYVTVVSSVESMEHPGLVSVVIPTKDRPEMLRRAVLSVLGQTYTPVELIVVDDGSAEPAREAIGDLEAGDLERFVIRRHEENQGGAAARNTGIREARGEYIAFLDDDDRWTPHKLEKQIAALREAGGNAGVAFTGNRQLDAEGNTVDVHIRTTDGDVSERILYGNYIGSFSGVLVRRELVDTVGFLDERFPAWQDWEYLVRLAQHTEFVAVPEPLVCRYIDHENRISPGYERKREVASLMFEECLRGPALEHGVERRVRGSLQARIGRVAWLEGKFGEARSRYARAIRIYPYDRSFWAFLLALSGGPYTMRLAKVTKTLLAQVSYVVKRVRSGGV